MHGRIVGDLKKFKATKPPKTIGKSQLDALEKNIKLYEGKMQGVERQAKVLAKKLNGMLKEGQKVQGMSRTAKAALDDLVKKAIADIVDMSTRLKKGERQLQSFNAKLTNAKKQERTDARSLINWALEVYDMANKMFTWTFEGDDVINKIDRFVILSTKDDFFEPVTG